jgi:flavin reductase (DIM6/NTAB) family NADH-FMN oxidoreductase RutF
LTEKQKELSPTAQALGRIPSGLFVVTARDEEGVEGAFLASWVMQAGFDPPSLTVAVGRDRALRGLFEVGAPLAVSVVGAAERSQLGPYYRGVEPGPEALETFDVDRTPAGLAVIRGCLAWLECRVTDTLESGDHVILLAEVHQARAGNSEEPAVHTRSNGLSY